MAINIQPIEKREISADGTVQVHSIFYTLQGEGPFSGQPAVFVRLAGCNLQCPACDTDYTSARTPLSPVVILDAVIDAFPASITLGMKTMQNPPLIVLTGGEPFRQGIGPFVHAALDAGFRVQIETNGSLYQDLTYSNPNLTVVCSPKTGKLAAELVPHIRAFKYVVKTGDTRAEDGLPIHALDHSVGGHVARPPAHFQRSRIYVQPIDVADPVANESHLQTAVASCLKFGYTLCLQTHKIANLA